MVGGEPKKAKRKKVKEAMGSKKARKKARRNALELLDIASRGCTIRLESLLAKHTDLDVNFAGRDGETALHKVRHCSTVSSSRILDHRRIYESGVPTLLLCF